MLTLKKFQVLVRVALNGGKIVDRHVVPFDAIPLPKAFLGRRTTRQLQFIITHCSHRFNRHITRKTGFHPPKMSARCRQHLIPFDAISTSKGNSRPKVYPSSIVHRCALLTICKYRITTKRFFHPYVAYRRLILLDAISIPKAFPGTQLQDTAHSHHSRQNLFAPRKIHSPLLIASIVQKSGSLQQGWGCQNALTCPIYDFRHNCDRHTFAQLSQLIQA